MRIIMVDGRRIDCKKIEPSLKPGYVVIDEDYAIALIDIICIVAINRRV